MKTTSRFGTIPQCRHCLALTLVLTAFAINSLAATYTWTGTGFFGTKDYLWSTPANWAGLAAPSPGETNVTIIFPNTSAPKITTNDIVGLSVATIQFQGTNYVIHGKPAGNALGLNGGIFNWVVLATGDNCSFANTCPLSLQTTGVVAVTTGLTLTIKSTIGGPGGFTKMYPGFLDLQANGANTYTGTTYVDDGWLTLNNNGIAIPGPLVIGNTNMANDPTVALHASEQIGGTVPVTVHQNATLFLEGYTNTIGTLNMVDGSKIYVGVNQTKNPPGLLKLNGNVYSFQQTNAWQPVRSEIFGSVDLGLFTRTFTPANGSFLAIYGAVSGNSIFNPGITKSGDGDLLLSYGTNTYVGPTLAESGSFYIGGDYSLGATNGGTTVNAGATLVLLNCRIGFESLTLNGPSAAPALTPGGSNWWAGTITVNGDCGIYINSSDYLDISGAITGTGSIRKTGDGILELSGLGGNTFTGGLYCQGGWTYLGKSASAPALSGPLVIGRAGEANQWIPVFITQINQIPNNVPVILLDHGSLETKSGVTETIGSVEITGGLLYGNGVITLNGNVTNHLSTNSIGYLTGDIVLPATRTIHCDAGSTLQSGGNLSGGGGVTKTGPGELNFGAAHTYAGETLVKEGTLALSGAGRPGSTAAGTTVEAAATLFLNNANVTNEALIAYGGGNGEALSYIGTNVWSGSVEVHSGAVLKANPASKLAIIGPISGDSGLTHIGNGTLTLGGNTDNTFTGALTFREGLLQFAKSGARAMPEGAGNNLVVGYPTNNAPVAVVQTLADNQFATATGASAVLNAVTLNYNSSLDCGGFKQTIPNLIMFDSEVFTGSGGVLTLPGNLTVDADNGHASQIFGELRLTTGPSGAHMFTINTNVVGVIWANISESGGAQNIYKDGIGFLDTFGSNSFSGTFTLHQGRWYAAGSNPFGTIAGPTVIESGSTLFTYTGEFDEPFSVAGNGDGGNWGAFEGTGTNTFTGPITLTSNASFYADTNSIMAFSGVVNGPGGLTKIGDGIVRLLGSGSNSYAGPTLVTRGRIELGKTNTVAVPGALTVGSPSHPGEVRLLRSEQIADAGAVTLQSNGSMLLDGNNETVGSLLGSGLVTQSAIQTGLLTVGADDSSATFSGIIQGGGGLTKTGLGTVTLTGNNFHTGVTTVNAGTLLVMGQQPQSAVSLLSGGRLGGTGKVGHLSDLNGHVAPGASPGILVCSNFSTFSAANQLQIEIAGPNPGGGHDQLQVNGSVLLMGGTIQLAMNFPGAISNQYVIVANDGVDPVSGTFTALSEGGTLTNNGAIFQLTYHGGDGNDIALLQQSVAFAGMITNWGFLPNGRFAIKGNGTPDALYAVEATTNLAPPSDWIQIGAATADSQGLIQFSDIGAPQFPIRFYRLRIP